MKKIGYYTIRIFSAFLGYMPFFMIYGISDFLAVVLRHIIKYRKQTIRKNLQKCFPDLHLKEIKKIERKFYRNLSDITIESIKGLYMSRNQLEKRFQVTDNNVLQKFYEQGKDVLCVAGHYANWEWGILAVDFQIPHQGASLYKPFTNKYMEDFYISKRKRYGMEMIPIQETKEYFAKKKKQPVAYIMAADQYPGKNKNAIVVDFMGIETACLHGPEAYSRKANLPVVYFDIQRVKRGYYTMEVKELESNSAKTEFGVITQKFMSTLEKIIKAKPENWLWSHKRWKLPQWAVEEIKGYNEERRKAEKLL